MPTKDWRAEFREKFNIEQVEPATSDTPEWVRFKSIGQQSFTIQDMEDFISDHDKQILQLVIEDVPHQYQERLLAKLKGQND